MKNKSDTIDTQIKSGAHVEVFQLPISKEDSEGVAVVRNKATDMENEAYGSRKLEWWYVQFETEGSHVLRKISPADLVDN